MVITNSRTRCEANQQQLKEKEVLSQLKLSTIDEGNLVLETSFMDNWTIMIHNFVQNNLALRNHTGCTLSSRSSGTSWHSVLRAPSTQCCSFSHANSTHKDCPANLSDFFFLSTETVFAIALKEVQLRREASSGNKKCWMNSTSTVRTVHKSD